MGRLDKKIGRDINKPNTPSSPDTNTRARKKERKKEMPEAVKITAEELKQKRFDPLRIGTEVLKRFGYKVQLRYFGYNSVEIKVVDKRRKKIYERDIGL